MIPTEPFRIYRVWDNTYHGFSGDDFPDLEAAKAWAEYLVKSFRCTPGIAHSPPRPRILCYVKCSVGPETKNG